MRCIRVHRARRFIPCVATMLALSFTAHKAEAQTYPPQPYPGYPQPYPPQQSLSAVNSAHNTERPARSAANLPRSYDFGRSSDGWNSAAGRQASGGPSFFEQRADRSHRRAQSLGRSRRKRQNIALPGDTGRSMGPACGAKRIPNRRPARTSRADLYLARRVWDGKGDGNHRREQFRHASGRAQGCRIQTEENENTRRCPSGSASAVPLIRDKTTTIISEIIYVSL
jgi:hypothetical protein